MAASFTPTVAAGKLNAGLADAKDTLFSTTTPEGRIGLISLTALVAGMTVAYWRVLVHTSKVWSEPQYSHGWIVPLIGLYVLWCRRPDQSERSELTPMLGGAAAAGVGLVAAGFFAGLPWLQGVGLAVVLVGTLAVGLLHQPFAPISNAWGCSLQSPIERALIIGSGAATLLVLVSCSGLLPEDYYLPLTLFSLVAHGTTLLAASLASRVGPLPRLGAETWASLLAILSASIAWTQASKLDMMPIMRLCLLVSLLGAFGLVGGRRLLRWSGPGVTFLVFMFPLPSLLEHTLLPILQKVATIVSTIVLQLIGLPVYREGSTIQGLDMPLHVAEACSGLRMSTIFGAMTIAMVFLINRPWWDRFTILLSAIPVALLVNVVRIVVTAIIYYVFPGNEGLHQTVHDWAGIAMMPLALGILWLELAILSNLTVAEEVGYKPATGAPAV